MDLDVKVGDVLDERVDVLICTANATLRMSGGVNGAIHQRGGRGVQEELMAHLAKIGKKALPPGSVVRTGPGPLTVKHILHLVGVTIFYEADVETVGAALKKALCMAADLDARTVATPAIATGFGPLSMEDFGRALALGIADPPSTLETLRVVLRREEDRQDVMRGAWP